ncbi:abnormal spindle-like microcephaly-associated protein like [Crotalus adamanteus]|uniref:Abnormal spindle-like microcephaly-associated protein like n=1 Tax=Crotalus adamanteus TaxID=8729 RepID=A0AAW1BQE4_CROAD
MAERKQGIGPAGLQEPCSPERSSRWAASPGCEDGNDAVLSLSHFSRPPFLSFGSVRVGTSCVRRLVVENPNAEPVHGAVYRPPPASKGFTVEQDSFLLQPGERIYILITWTPLEGGKVRELITFIINDVVKHRAVLLGNAEQPITKKKNLKSGEYLEDVKNGREEYAENLGRKRTLKSCDENGSKSDLKCSVSKSQNGDKQKTRSGSASQKSKNFKRTKNIVPVAQSQLTFVKPLKTDIPRHPMPFAAKNMFYDEQWKEKQQRGFTWWLNFVLTPDDFTLKTDISQVNTSCLILGTETYKSSVPKAPTKEEASLRAYTTRCKLNKLRRSACRLFTCEEMVKAIKRLEIEIEAKRLLVRKDRHLWKDIGERQKILSWILCYNPLWLRIGLETIFGELIALESNSDVMSLAIFILNRLLWNPDIAAEYRHPTVPHLYRDGHEEALSKFTLKKLLLLVCFLDRAKVSRIIEHDPCLFFKNAEFKSSKEILLVFSRDFLSGEGDLSRHLGFLGFPVNHVQTPLDEFDFAVTNLATDLQCGIRLV